MLFDQLVEMWGRGPLVSHPTSGVAGSLRVLCTASLQSAPLSSSRSIAGGSVEDVSFLVRKRASMDQAVLLGVCVCMSVNWAYGATLGTHPRDTQLH
jgi:hypothetical protein